MVGQKTLAVIQFTFVLTSEIVTFRVPGVIIMPMKKGLDHRGHYFQPTVKKADTPFISLIEYRPN